MLYSRVLPIILCLPPSDSVSNSRYFCTLLLFQYMDLNVLPDEHEDHTYRSRSDQQHPHRREQRDDRHRGGRRPYPDEGHSQRYHGHQQNKRFRPNDNRYNKLPDGWLDCPAYGKNIDCIIPSKVPLGDDFVVHGKRYSWREVLYEQSKLRRDLGLVIDLTNTTRYYEASDFRKAGVTHVKIACKGRGSVPGNDSVNDFIYEVLQFYSRKEQSNTKYILVHCTHGFNRTGYMIVHFLVRTQSISVTEALQRFANARPPGIYKQDYIDELYTFYGERRPESLICPPTPEWKSSSELDMNGNMMQGEDDGGGVAAEKEVLKNIEMTNDDIIGDALPHNEQDIMQQCCYDLLKLNRRAKGNLQFPGSHPVSLNRDNLQLLRQRYYYATWKADGTRYMMLITGNGCYLIDRKFCFRRVRVRFPLKQNNEDFGKETHNFTLLDGEMVIETLRDTQKQVRRYLIYDVMAVNNVPVGEMPFCERWNLLSKEVIEPRNLERQLFEQCRHRFYRYERGSIPFYRYDMEPFSVRRKDFWVLSAATKILNKFIPSLSHEADGLIFQGWDDPYVPRTHEGLLKWKYMDSVDFFFEVTEDHRELLFLNEGRKRKIVEGRVFFENGSDPSAFSGKIIECHWDSKKNMWVFMRIRTDKSNPNEFNTYMKVMRSIKDNITQDLLLNEISQIVRLPMYADRIRGDCETHMHSGKRR